MPELSEKGFEAWLSKKEEKSYLVFPNGYAVLLQKEKDSCWSLAVECYVNEDGSLNFSFMGQDIYRMVSEPKFERLESMEGQRASKVATVPEDMYDLDMLHEDEAWEIEDGYWNDQNMQKGSLVHSCSRVDAQYEQRVWKEPDMQSKISVCKGSEEFEAGMFVGMLAKAQKIPEEKGIEMCDMWWARNA